MSQLTTLIFRYRFYDNPHKFCDLFKHLWIQTITNGITITIDLTIKNELKTTNDLKITNDTTTSNDQTIKNDSLTM